MDINRWFSSSQPSIKESWDLSFIPQVWPRISSRSSFALAQAPESTPWKIWQATTTSSKSEMKGGSTENWILTQKNNQWRAIAINTSISGVGHLGTQMVLRVAGIQQSRIMGCSELDGWLSRPTEQMWKFVWDHHHHHHHHHHRQEGNIKPYWHSKHNTNQPLKAWKPET